MQEPQRRIRALYTASTITVYQAYSPEIGISAVRRGRFPAVWKRDRMTWVIKPRSQSLSMAEDDRNQQTDARLRRALRAKRAARVRCPATPPRPDQLQLDQSGHVTGTGRSEELERLIARDRRRERVFRRAPDTTLTALSRSIRVAGWLWCTAGIRLIPRRRGAIDATG
ncbi:DUF4291 family protein [Streptomyces sp. NPDC056821]|uniref:DUF4291 family protein n=1 Tax=unclassified Streptomyces TaxID=2593676 RepID=UPI0036917DE5